MSHILDDFVFIGLENSIHCQWQLECYLYFAILLGIPIKHSKTVAPTTVVPIHGIEIVTSSMQARQSTEKLHTLRHAIASFSKCWTACLQEWQSLIGSKSFACCVIRPGRLFLHRLICAILSFSSPRHRIHITSPIRDDCAMWLSFPQSSNGVYILCPWKHMSSAQLRLFSDASDWGYAVIFFTHWAQGKWACVWRYQHISALEFSLIYLTLHLWGA